MRKNKNYVQGLHQLNKDLPLNPIIKLINIIQAKKICLVFYLVLNPFLLALTIWMDYSQDKALSKHKTTLKCSNNNLSPKVPSTNSNSNPNKNNNSSNNNSKFNNKINLNNNLVAISNLKLRIPNKKK